jgi:hypothetical protein
VSCLFGIIAQYVSVDALRYLFGLLIGGTAPELEERLAKKPTLEVIPNPSIVPLPTRQLSERAQHAAPSHSVRSVELRPCP